MAVRALFHSTRLALALAAAFTLVGCSSLMPGVHVSIPDEDNRAVPTPAPRYHAGDIYSYEDRVSGKTSTYTVDRFDGQRVTWRIGDAFRFDTSVQPMLPWLHMKAETVLIDRQLLSGSVFPLRAGQRDRRVTLKTHIEQTDNPTLDYREEFRCDVGGWETVDTKAGAYQALPIQCTRYVSGEFPPSGFVNFRAGKTVTWFAPAVGQYVRHVEMDKRFIVTKDLWLVEHRTSLSLLSPGQQAQLTRELARFTATAKAGASQSWQYPKAQLRINAQMEAPGPSTRSGCRPYHLTVERSGSQHLLHRQACN